jgi:putative FmdB family regulatory protein
MPTYAYKCTSCDQEFEAYSSIADRDAIVGTNCDQCSLPGVIRIPIVNCGFRADTPPQASSDWKQLMANMRKKNTTLSHKSTIGNDL